MFAHIRAITCLVVLIFAVNRLHHATLQQAIGILREQRIPVTPPDRFDHVPSRATEIGFEFLNDFAVAAHRAIEALKIAVDYKDEVIETFARRQRDRTERLGFIHLAVTHECPDLAAFGVDDAAVMQVFHEARLINRLYRAKPHRDRRELPEIGHQPRMRIA